MVPRLLIEGNTHCQILITDTVYIFRLKNIFCLKKLTRLNLFLILFPDDEKKEDVLHCGHSIGFICRHRLSYLALFVNKSNIFPHFRQKENETKDLYIIIAIAPPYNS
jgi:hypothetical protein